MLRYLGHARWAKNPKYCEGCFRTLQANHGGAEVDCSLIFADVRGSTALAERMRPTEFRALMGRFYDEAFAALIDFNAIVDKFVGDEVIGIFIPAYSGQEHARHAVEAARRLLEVTGHDRPGGPWIPIGIGVHSGVAFVGSVGQGPDTELTAMGDAVNVAARLAAAAGRGEILDHRRSSDRRRRHRRPRTSFTAAEGEVRPDRCRGGDGRQTRGHPQLVQLARLFGSRLVETP